jgi:ring-1,2-phenylacetyl-CoA epoxidase subunit PaaD
VVSGRGTTAVAPELDAVWQLLATIPDPEIPVISIVELGIVRAVTQVGSELVVTVTPTYSGCPATRIIATDIRRKLLDAGIAYCRIETRLAPAWTTDWMAPEARERLRLYGIAPPGDRGGARVIDLGGLRRRSAAVVPCPRCGSSNTVELSHFGSTPCKAQFRCTECREPFDYFKPH